MNIEVHNSKLKLIKIVIEPIAVHSTGPDLKVLNLSSMINFICNKSIYL